MDKGDFVILCKRNPDSRLEVARKNLTRPEAITQATRLFANGEALVAVVEIIRVMEREYDPR